LLLAVTPQWEVSDEAADGSEAVTKAEELQPDVVLLDIGLPRLNGIEAAAQIRVVAPNSKIVFLTAHSSSDIVHAALRTGALGYVLKEDAISELLPALKSVMSERQYLSKGVTL